MLAAAIALILIVVGVTVSPCLRCFFFSEDLVQTYLAAQELSAHSHLLLERLTMPWVQCSNMGLFYRPIVDFSFISDYLLYHGSVALLAAGSHLTNLLCHLTSSVFCLLICRQLLLSAATTGPEKSDATPRQAEVKATLTGLIAGLLFGLNPLQGETVYWLVCRCDCLCTMLSLVSFYLYLRSQVGAQASGGLRPRLALALSLVTCLGAILAKEQAVFIPFVILLHGGFFAGASASSSPAAANSTEHRSVWKRFAFILPYVIMLAAYTVLRLALLGGIGGYHGSIGVVLNETIAERLAAPLMWSKLFYPLDEYIFASRPFWPWLFSAVYLLTALGCLQGLRTIKPTNPTFRVAAFLVLAAVIVLIPTTQSFVLIESLFGGRCAYLAQAFFSMTLAIVLTAIKPKILRNLLVPAYLILLALTNVLNGSAWVNRSENLRAFQKAANEWARSAPDGQKLCVLNVPLDCRELSSVYDLEQLRCLLRPPANSIDLSDRLVQPTYLRMTPDALNKARMRRLLERGDVDFVTSSANQNRPFQIMQPEALSSHLLPIDALIQVFAVPPAPAQAADKSIQPYQLDLRGVPDPQRADFVTITVAPQSDNSANSPSNSGESSSAIATIRAMPVNQCPKGKTLFILWHSDLSGIEPYINWSTAQFSDDGKRHTYIFPVADRTSWKYAEKLNQVILGNLPSNYKVLSARLTSEDDLVPQLSNNSEADGFAMVNENEGYPLQWDAATVSGAKSVSLHISEADLSYSHLVGGFREFAPSKHDSKRISQLPLQGKLTLKRSDFPMIGKYEVRVSACDAEGRLIGFYSDPVNVMVTDRPFASEFDKALFNLRAQRCR
jgi:hypothetical protein